MGLNTVCALVVAVGMRGKTLLDYHGKWMVKHFSYYHGNSSYHLVTPPLDICSVLLQKQNIKDPCILVESAQ